MVELTNTKSGSRWISNFHAEDRTTAELLANSLLVVSSGSLRDNLTKLIEDILEQPGAIPIALYAEQECPRDAIGGVAPYFPDTETGRASGEGPPALRYHDTDKQIGSEGAIANLIKNISVSRPSWVLSHPGPDGLRSKKCRTIVIVTDFIGSGKRMYDLLNSFSDVATIQSWRSYGLLRFQIVAYAATARGFNYVQSHQLCDDIRMYIAAPTIRNTFTGRQRKAVINLCEKYNPTKGSALGFKNTGSLIAFAHGLPNNTPAILHWDSKKWSGLFPRRSTGWLKDQDFSSSESELTERLTQPRKFRP